MQAMLEKYKKINRKGKPAGAPMSVASVAGRGPAAHPVRPVEDEAPKHPMHSVLSRVRAAVKEEAATTASTAAAAAHAAEVVPSSSGEGGSSLAILVLIIDEFPHEALWRLWLQRGGVHERGRVRFFFHAKFPDRVRSPWVKYVHCALTLPPSHSLTLSDTLRHSPTLTPRYFAIQGKIGGLFLQAPVGVRGDHQGHVRAAAAGCARRRRRT